MKTFSVQPSIEFNQTLGGSAFRLECAARNETERLGALVGVRLFVGVTAFAPFGSHELLTRRSPSVQVHQRRRLPVVKAIGRAITQEEIDDAFDD